MDHPVVQTALGVFFALVVYGLVDRFVLSKVAAHLENLIEGN